MSSSESRLYAALARVPVGYWWLGGVLSVVGLVLWALYRPSISAEDFDAGVSDLESSLPGMVNVTEHADFRALRDPGSATCPTGISGEADTDVQELRAVVIAEVEGEAAAEQTLADIEEAWAEDDAWELEEVGTTSGSDGLTGVTRYEYTREWGGTLSSRTYVDHVQHEETDGHAIEIRVIGDCLRHTDGRSSVGEYEFDMPSFEGYSWDQEDDSG